MRNLSIFLALFIIFMINKSDAKLITWSEAIELVQKNNSEVIAAEKSLMSTNAIEKTSYSGFLPRLSASLYETKSKSEGFDQATNYGAQLTLSQNIFSGFSDLNKNKMYSANTQAARATYQSTLSGLSADLRSAFIGIIFAEKFKKLTADIISRRKENLKNVQLQFQSGRENKGSVLLSEAYVEQAILDDLAASHLYEVSAENLKRLLNVSEDVQIIESEQELFLNEIRQFKSQIPDFKKLAQINPEYQTSKAQTQANLYSYQMSQSQFYPSLDLSGNYGNYDTTYFPEKNRWSLSLTLSLPLFDGAKDFYTTKSNYYKYESSLNQTNDKLIQTQTKLKKAYQDYIESIQKEKVDFIFNKAADIRVQIARSKYKNGLLSFDDWDLIETDLIQKQKSLLNSIKDRVVKLSLWEQAQGVGVLSEKK